ncbi:hypothetical protein V8Z80_08250 [Orrella sp. JC864]|uniref:hypothetical protein n=1 Tax=Orrella sp. JC864 TaxID=3120298 RepID=UPI00300B994A
MDDNYEALRKAAKRRNIFCHPDVISEYRAAVNPEVILALLAERDALRKALAELVALEADGWHAGESSIESWERARAALSHSQGVESQTTARMKAPEC